MLTAPHQNDQYVQILHDRLGTPGQSGFDSLAQSAGRGISRIFESGRLNGKEFKEYSVPPRWILRGGCCVALCQDGLVRPALEQYEPLHIVGFVYRAMDGDRVSIRACGGILLTVEGANENAKGSNVFALGPDQFVLGGVRGGLLLGEVDYFQNGKVLVRFGDSPESGKNFYRAPSRAHY